MLVDGICAYALAWTSPDLVYAFRLYLIYNFCAFVLQMPIGAILDGYMQRNRTQGLPFIYALTGSAITLTGAICIMFLPATRIFEPMGVIILGIGNALFHIGGGVGSIYEDHENDKKGSNLGLFVAPGALGLFLGSGFAYVSPPLSLGFYLIISVIVYSLLSKTYSKGSDNDIFVIDNEKEELIKVLSECDTAEAMLERIKEGYPSYPNVITVLKNYAKKEQFHGRSFRAEAISEVKIVLGLSTSTPKTALGQEHSEAVVRPIHLENDPEHIKCPNCGLVQMSNRKVCFRCGSYFDFR